MDPVTIFTGSVPPVPPACQADQLSFALARDLGSLMQQPGAYFSFTNTSTTTCSLYGYPGFELVSTSGQLIPLTATRGSSYQIIDPDSQLVTLNPDMVAYFGFGWVDVNQPTGTTSGCETAAGALAIPPGTTQQLSTVAHLSSLVCPSNGVFRGQITAVAPGPAFTPSSPY